MQERARILRRISSEHLRYLARPFFAAGWSPRDVLHAIDHSPADRQHGYTSGVRSVPGWVRARLTEWLGPDEVPLPSRSQRLAEARRQVLADQAARRARDATGRAAAADYRTQAARAREMLMQRPRPVIGVVHRRPRPFGPAADEDMRVSTGYEPSRQPA